jgi:two-component system cell cycle sensor histidine kinase/response regulator CckA
MQIEHTEFQDQLVRGLAHRMNNILTLFHGYVGLLIDNKNLDRATLEGLAKIQNGAKAATELMDRTHSLVRPSTLVWREIDLALLVPMLKPSFEAFRNKKSTIEIDCADNLPHVWADMGRLKTAIIEVVRNACEATGAGGTVRIEICADDAPATLSAAAQPLSWVCLKVIDNGPGIPPEMMEKVFAPFFSTKKKQNATGLGLTVALGSMQQLGGLIRIESEPGETKVQLLLPSRSEPARTLE